MSFFIQLSQPTDFGEIAQLQARFQLSALAPSQIDQGFVTTELDEALMTRMREQKAMWVARSDEGELAAYACAVEWQFYRYSDFVEEVFTLFPLAFDDRFISAPNSFIYGPACIEPRFRGQGLISQLTDVIRARYAQTREFGVCFIDVRNARSLAAHERKLGFRRVAQLPFADVTYDMLAFPTNSSGGRVNLVP